MSKYEVTQVQWRKIMGSDPEGLSNKGCDQCPVESVSWDDAQLFISKLNTLTGLVYRLPTEAEWEFAARGGGRSKSYQYSGSNNLDEVAWYSENYRKGYTYGSKRTTQPVGKKRPNELGLYDMSGNIWEWCDDRYIVDYNRLPETNPTAANSLGVYRIIKGGFWGAYPENCRIAYRSSYDPEARNVIIGFRLVRSDR